MKNFKRQKKITFTMEKLLFGTAGIPASSSGPTAVGIGDVKKLGLGAMELEFVHSVNISKEKAPEVKQAHEKNGVELTCHAPYYINLNALKLKKKGASRGRIVNAATRLWECGGYSCCFHPGFYMGGKPDIVFSTI